MTLSLLCTILPLDGLFKSAVVKGAECQQVLEQTPVGDEGCLFFCFFFLLLVG